MTYYVPDWDDPSHSLKDFDDLSFLHTGKGGVHSHQHHHSPQKKSSAALVPNHNVPGSLTQMAMQGEAVSHITGEVAHASVPVAVSSHEDEMLSWLQYPLEDSFDRNYCSELFGELVNPHVHLVKDAFLQRTMRDTDNAHDLTIVSMGGRQAGSQQFENTSVHGARLGVNSGAAMAMGAGRAAGLVSRVGSEAFTGVRTNIHPSALLKPSSSTVAEPSLDSKTTLETHDPISSLLDGKKAPVLSSATSALSSGCNFSLFARPVATTLDSLRTVGAVSGPTNVERARQTLATDSPTSCEPSVGDSNCRAVMNMQPSSQQSTGFSSQVSIARDGGASTPRGWSLPPNLPCRQDVPPRLPDARILSGTAGLNSHVTCFSGSANTVSENVVGTTETAERTVSPSRLSGSSIEEIAEEAFAWTLKKVSADCTEDVEDVAANAKKPPPGPRPTKRSRAAETHNESEKKRRNKINVRLRTLQSLIPNSNKTDKASVLDEAIEYTKMLQAQVQFMSMRTGMFVPPMMMPSGMHYVPVHQMPFPHLGMGMGMGMGMGFGMGPDMGMSMHPTDINAATVGLDVGASVTTAGAGAGAAFNSSPTPSESAARQVHAGATQQCSSVHDASLCLPTSPYKMMLAQQPLQPMLMNLQMNPDMYNALLQQSQPEENHASNINR